MPYNLRVIPLHEFMRSDVSGKVDLQSSRELLNELMVAGRRENIDRFLIDCRQATSHPSILDVWALVQDFSGFGVRPDYTIAVLGPKDAFAPAEFLELVATNRGYHVKAFLDFEAAFTWLESGQPT